MSLSDFADQYAGQDPGPNPQSIARYIARLTRFAGTDERALAMLMSFFWQIVTRTEAFQRIREKLDISPAPLFEQDWIIVPHRKLPPHRYDLVILDRSKSHDQSPQVEVVRPDKTDLQEASARWHQALVLQFGELALRGNLSPRAKADWSGMVSAVDPDFAVILIQSHGHEFKVIAAPMPQVQYVSIPRSAWGVSAPPGSSPASSVGGVVKQVSSGLVGVTVAYHALTAGGCASPGATVDINGTGGSSQTGSVISVDLVSDSGFVELPDPGATGFARRATSGPLAGITPTMWENVDFDGYKSGKIATKVTGWSYDVPFVASYNQLKVYTDPVTSPGDSGVALLNKAGHILGFAFFVTGIGAGPSLAAWIWADSVYTVAHGLVPF